MNSYELWYPVLLVAVLVAVIHGLWRMGKGKR